MIDKEKAYRTAFFLNLFTIFYNIAEGILSVYFGIEDETLTLFGFGADSFIEAISGLGIAHMVIRIRNNPGVKIDNFEKRALQITGLAFYLLCIGLIAGIILRLIENKQPESTLAGVIISIISIAVMWFLMKMKVRIGKSLHSEPILADASCTRVCIQMSLVLLGSSLIYELTKINYIDILATIGIIYFSYREGKEAFEKAKGKHDCHCA
jgi:hypothetical protein